MMIAAKHTAVVNIEVDDEIMGTTLRRMISERCNIPYDTANAFLTDEENNTFVFNVNSKSTTDPYQLISNDKNISYLVDASNVLIDGEAIKTGECDCGGANHQVDFLGIDPKEIHEHSINLCKNIIGE